MSLLITMLYCAYSFLVLVLYKTYIPEGFDIYMLIVIIMPMVILTLHGNLILEIPYELKHTSATGRVVIRIMAILNLLLGLSVLATEAFTVYAIASSAKMYSSNSEAYLLLAGAGLMFVNVKRIEPSGIRGFAKKIESAHKALLAIYATIFIATCIWIVTVPELKTAILISLVLMGFYVVLMSADSYE